jgi:hypothetical protein
MRRWPAARNSSGVIGEYYCVTVVTTIPWRCLIHDARERATGGEREYRSGCSAGDNQRHDASENDMPTKLTPAG